jgi:hypothetical protein
MKTYVEIKGGLGNMLFQIATGISYSLEYNTELFVDTNNYHGSHHNIKKYLNNIFSGIKFENSQHIQTFYENGFEYNKIPKYSSNLKLNGFFQSEKYFVKYRNEIIKTFMNEDYYSDKCKNYLNKFDEKNIVSIHVRRGDYVKLQNFHTLLNLDYYKNAISHFNQNDLFLIFSDDIEWCKENFSFLNNKFFIDDLDDYESLYIMSKCKNHIIANSTFSWWGAWLNIDGTKKIICPKNWFGPMNSHLVINDLYCDNWIKI